MASLTIEANHPVMVNRVLLATSCEVGVKLNNLVKFQTLHHIYFLHNFVFSQSLALHEATLDDSNLVQVWMRHPTNPLVKLFIKEPEPNFERPNLIYIIFTTGQAVLAPQQH